METLLPGASGAVVDFKLAGGGSVATGGGAVGVQIKSGVAAGVYAQIITVAGAGRAVGVGLLENFRRKASFVFIHVSIVKSAELGSRTLEADL